MKHEILKYENIFILMEKMGQQYSQTPLKSPDTNFYFLSKIFFVHS